MACYRSFLFPGSVVGDGFLVLESRESHHLVRVLRARVGESVDALDGRGRCYSGRVETTDAKAVRISVERVETLPAPAVRVTLLLALPKSKAMDLILRMSTEIGASVIQPVFTEHSEVQLRGERLESKVDKWRLTMIEACKQCGLVYVPELIEPVSLREWARTVLPTSGQLRLVASLEAGSRPLLETLRDAGASAGEVIVAVGPEGDFSEDEYSLLRDSGFVPVRLGANVLRAETAAAYLLSVVDQAFR